MNATELEQDHREMMEHLMDSSLRAALGGLGGCKHFEITDYPIKFRKYIQQYVDHDIDSSEAFISYLYENNYLSKVFTRHD